jgi:integrase/recombinase XerD
MITRVGEVEIPPSIYKMIAPLRALYPDRDLCPATIRQSVIANLLNEKKMPVEDVQLFAGHKYPSSTEKYKREDITEQRQKINMWHPLG